MALQRGEGKKAENLYEKLQHALDQTGSAPQLIDASLREKLTRFMETLDAWRDYAQTHPFTICLGDIGQVVLVSKILSIMEIKRGKPLKLELSKSFARRVKA